MSDYHDRMPVIIRPEFIEEWLAETTEAQRLQELMLNSEYRLRVTKVSPYVNSVKNTGPECCAPVERS